MTNIFIEGIQGMGKSTLLQEIHTKLPQMHVCREGDYSPVELAWCAWMDPEQYRMILNRYGSLREEIEKNTVREENHYIVSYTKIITDIPGFHKDLEQYEIYNGRRALHDMEKIIISRYRKFSGAGFLFECAFMQNIVEDMILFHQLSDEEIIAFYHRLYDAADQEHFLLLYLYGENIEESTEIIRKERTDDHGNEMWYRLMLEYLSHSPYGKRHGCEGFDDLAAHFRHRQQLELRIINEVIRERAVVLPAKRWKIEEVINLMK